MKYYLLMILFISKVACAGGDSLKVDTQLNNLQFFLVNDISAGYKRSLTNNSSVRLHFDVKSSYSERKDKSDFFGIFSNRSRDVVLSDNLIITYIDYIWWSSISHRVNLYYGLGPLLEYGHSKYIYITNLENSSDYKSLEDIFSIGINLLLGVEVFVSSNISLLGEYRLVLKRSGKKRLGYERKPDENTWKKDGKFTESILKYEVNKFRIGVSIYF